MGATRMFSPSVYSYCVAVLAAYAELSDSRMARTMGRPASPLPVSMFAALAAVV